MREPAGWTAAWRLRPVGASGYGPGMTVTDASESSRICAAPGAVAVPFARGDFMSCPLLYRFRVVDHLPESPVPAATRGTVVHAVLERLFDLPAAERTLAQAAALLRARVGAAARAEEPELRAAVRRPGRAATCARSSTAPSSCSDATSSSRTRPGSSRPSASCSSRASSSPGCCCAATSTGSTSTPAGDTARRRLQDRPGARARASRPRRCSRCASTRWCCGACTARVPRLLQLLYLGSGEVLRYEPDEADLLRHRAQGAARSGRRSSGPPRPVTGGRAPAGCATGATTRRCARPSAARLRRCRCPRCPPSRRARPGAPSPRTPATRSDWPGASPTTSGGNPRGWRRPAFPRVEPPPVVPFRESLCPSKRPATHRPPPRRRRPPSAPKAWPRSTAGRHPVVALDGVDVDFAAVASPRSWGRRARASRR